MTAVFKFVASLGCIILVFEPEQHCLIITYSTIISLLRHMVTSKAFLCGLFISDTELRVVVLFSFKKKNQRGEEGKSVKSRI